MIRVVRLSLSAIVILLSLHYLTSLLAQVDFDQKSPASQQVDSSYTSFRHGAEVSGIFSPAGPPSEPPKRIDAGGDCIVDLKQAYKVTGTLSGTFNIDYRIKVDGPCGSPSGTYDEDWIAYGRFTGKFSEKDTKASFTYIAHVEAGGKVEGKMDFEQGLAGELVVRGDFADGKLSYKGGLTD